jgi:hypothetical protein
MIQPMFLEDLGLKKVLNKKIFEKKNIFPLFSIKRLPSIKVSLQNPEFQRNWCSSHQPQWQQSGLDELNY